MITSVTRYVSAAPLKLPNVAKFRKGDTENKLVVVATSGKAQSVIIILLLSHSDIFGSRLIIITYIE